MKSPGSVTRGRELTRPDLPGPIVQQSTRTGPLVLRRGRRLRRTDSLVMADVSSAYLASIEVPARIASAEPAARLAAILRDPSERVRSRIESRRGDGLERRETFAQIVDAENERQPWPDATGGTYIVSGFVSHILARYFDPSDRSQILLLTTEEFAADPPVLVGDVSRFIGADPNAPIDTWTAHHCSGGPISIQVVGRLWTDSIGLRTVLRPVAPESWSDAVFRFAVRSTPAERNEVSVRRLRAHFAEAVGRLSAIVGRYLTPWTRGERLHGGAER